MRVISFKVSDDDYTDLKKLVDKYDLNFSKLLAPIIKDILVSTRNHPGHSIHWYTSQRTDKLYIYLSQLRDLTGKLNNILNEVE